MEGETIEIIDIASSSNMEHTYKDGRGGAYTSVISTGVRSGVISTGIIFIHYIRVGDGNGACSVNADDADDDDNSVVSSTSSSYWGRTTKRMKEEILQRNLMCVKNKRGPEGLRERGIHHANETKAQSHTFGAAKHFVPKNLEGDSE